MEQSQADRVQTALMIATLSVFLARYSNAGGVSNRKYLLGKDVKISDAVAMVNDSATEYGDEFATATFIHQDILTHALFRLRNHLKLWGIKLVVDPSLGDGRASRGAENLVQASSYLGNEFTVIYIVPQLVKFSGTPYIHDEEANSGEFVVCLRCRDQLGKKVRPKFSMCGTEGCDFGYPQFLDGFNGESLSPTEVLSIARARPYANVVKATLDKSKNPNAGIKGHTITFLHDNLVERTRDSERFPRVDVAGHLSVVFIGSENNPEDYSSTKKGRDLIKAGMFKGVLQLRPAVVNAFAKGLLQHNVTYANRARFQAMSDVDVADVISAVPIVVDISNKTLRIDSISTADVAGVCREEAAVAATVVAEDNATNDNAQFILPVTIDATHTFQQPRQSEDPTKTVLRATLSLFPNESVSDDVEEEQGKEEKEEGKEEEKKDEEPINIARKGEPMSEFDANDQLMLGAYPHLFFKGTRPPFRGSVSLEYVQHIMSFHDGRFARDRTLVFLLFDQFFRHALAREVKAKVASDPAKRTKIEELMGDEGIVDRLKAAIKDPSSKDAKALFREINPIIVASSASIPFSLAARNQFVSKMYSLCWYYGLPKFFNTWAPDDVNTCLAIRLAHAPDEPLPPLGSTGVDLIQSIVNKTLVGVDLKALATLNPVAQARIFHRMKQLVYCLVFGKHIDGSGHTKSRKSAPLSLQPKGAFGVCLAVAGTDETAGRWSLHHHSVLWAMPHVDFNLMCEDEKLQDAVAEGMRSILVGELSDIEWHDIALRRAAASQKRADAKAARYGAAMAAATGLAAAAAVASPIPADVVQPAVVVQPVRGALVMCPITVEYSADEGGTVYIASNPAFLERVEQTIGMVQVHRHMAACHKPPRGLLHCRFGYPHGHIDKTCPVLLKPVEPTAGEQRRFPYMVYDNFERLEHFPTSSYGLDVHSPFSPVDRRIIVWEIRSPEFLLRKDLGHEDAEEFDKLGGNVRFRVSTDQNFGPADVVNPDDTDVGVRYYSIMSDGRHVYNTPEMDRVGGSANGNVVTYNPLLTGVLGCNTACYLLGSAEQAKAAFFYIVKYVNKDGVELAGAASAMLAALKAVKFIRPKKAPVVANMPGLAEDGDSDNKEEDEADEEEEEEQEAGDGNVNESEQRSEKSDEDKAEEAEADIVKKFANMFVNQLQGAIEVASQQAASAILGYSPQSCTASFWQLYPNAAMKYVQLKLNDMMKPRRCKTQRIESPLPTGAPSLPGTPHKPGKDEDLADDNDYLKNVDRLLAETKAGYDDVEDEEDEAGQCGDIAFDEDGKVKEIVTQAMDYGHRGGGDMALLSLFEYVALISIVTVRAEKDEKTEKSADKGPVDDAGADEDEDSTRGGRVANATYGLAVGHPKADTHVQRVRSKFTIPEIVGTPPPCPAEYNQRTKAKCDLFGQWILTVFKSWDEFTQTPLAADTNASPRSWVNRSILRIIEHIRAGVKSSSLERLVTAVYRGRNVMKWEDMGNASDDEDDVVRQRGFGAEGDDSDEDEPDKAGRDDHELLAALLAFAAVEGKSDAGQVGAARDGYIAGQYDSMTSLLSSRTAAARDKLLLAAAEAKAEPDAAAALPRQAYVAEGCVLTVIDETTAKDAINAFVDRLAELNMGVKEDEESDDDDDDNDDRITRAQDFDNNPLVQERIDEAAAKAVADETIEEFVIRRQLNEGQKRAFFIIREALQQAQGTEGHKQLLLSLNDGPGVGKTYVLQSVEQSRQVGVVPGEKVCVREMINTASTGSAAAVFGAGSRTVHSALSIATKKKARHADGSQRPLKPVRLAALQGIFKNTKVLVIDEVSMLTPELLCDISDRLKEIKNNDEVFGGLHVILAGDFQQLPPAKGEGLYTWTIKGSRPIGDDDGDKVISAYKIRARQLFGLFQVEFLTEFKRAQEPKYIEFLKELRDLENVQPLSDGKLLEELYKRVAKSSDLDGDFKDALIAVQSNAERHRLNQCVVELRALEAGDVILEWDNPIKKYDDLPQPVISSIRDRHSGALRSRFLKGAPVYLTSNLAPVVAVANGFPGRMDSILWHSETVRAKVEIDIKAAQPGEVVRVPPPDVVFIELKEPMPASIRNDKALQMADVFGTKIAAAAAATGRFPVPLSMVKDRHGKNYITYGSGKSAVKVHYDKIEYDLGYAVTVYKLQGCTIERLLVDFNMRPVGLKSMDLRSLYVINSRVANLDRIRIMPFRQPPNVAKSTKFAVTKANFLTYMKKMSQSEELRTWRSCINRKTNVFDPTLLVPEEVKGKGRKKVKR